jgi:hypothetical protein
MKSPDWFLARISGTRLMAALAVCFACAAVPASANVSKQAKMKSSTSKVSSEAATLPMVGEDVMVQVKGVAIPFTSFGIVHRLETVPGVTSVQFNLKHGVAILRLAPNAYVTNDILRAAVKNASYTPGSITWVSTKVQQEHEAAQEAAKNKQTAIVPVKQPAPAPKQKD